MIFRKFLSALILFVLVNTVSVLYAEDPVYDTDNPCFPSCPAPHPNITFPLAPTLDSNSVQPEERKQQVEISEGQGRFSGMVFIPAGNFLLGSLPNEGRLDEKPQKSIYIRDFFISKYEVTASEFCEFLNKDGLNSRDGSPRVRLDCPDCPIEKTIKGFKPRDLSGDKPIVCLSWFGASEYAEWVGGRLPTSAEWEKAAHMLGSNAQDELNTPENSKQTKYTLPIVSAKMTGNVWQWCSDWYEKDYYGVSPVNNPPGPAIANERNIRGGSWVSTMSQMRNTNRHKAAPRGYFRTVGFRVVKDNT